MLWKEQQQWQLYTRVPQGLSDIPGGQGCSTPAAPRKIFSRSAVRRTVLTGEVTQVGFITQYIGKKSQPKHQHRGFVSAWLARDMTFLKTLVIYFDNPFVGINALLLPQPQGHGS